MRPCVAPVLSVIHLLLSLSLGNVLASSTGSSISAPIRHFEPSWAASCAQGTAVALRYQDSIVVLIRSPSSNIWRPTVVTPLESPQLTISDLPVRPLTKSTMAQFAPSWLSVGPQSLCAMTGLASDVEHLFRVLQKQVDAHWNIYDKDATTHSMTMDLAATFQQEIFSGSRPFGVQCLLVGTDDHDPERKFCVYTIDPSGNWQSWGGATAIGKYAPSVREELATKRKARISPSSLKEALEIIVDCWMETCKKQNINLHMEDDYQVLILQKDNGVSKFYSVVDEEVASIVQRAVGGRTK